MLTNQQLLIRRVRPDDRRQITDLMHFGKFVHRHLDWCEPGDWIGRQPYVLAEWNYQVMAVLACPPDPIDVAWIRLFAVSPEILVQDAWPALWASIHDQINNLDVIVAAIPIQEWFQNRLEDSRFEQINEIVMLRWERHPVPTPLKDTPFTIRAMKIEDLPAVYKVDDKAFGRLWKNSLELLEIAFSKSAISTVAETSQGIIGYQVSTANRSGGHLARLAVLPKWQRVGVGIALVKNVLRQFYLWGSLYVTVNTQTDNLPSLALYERAGFKRLGQIYPVYQLDLKS